MSASEDTDYDVIVVGAGPIGTSIALLVAQRGHRVIVFERFSEPYPMPRAVAMSHDSMRAFQSMGLTEAIKPALDPEDGAASEVLFVAEDGEVLMREQFASRSVSGFPAMSGFDQPGIEAVLSGAAQSHPRVAVRRGWAARGLTQDESSVRLSVASTDGDTERGSVVSAKFLIGADGANSTVRGLVDEPVHDLGFAADWLVVDVLSGPGFVPSIPLGQKLHGRPTTFTPSGPGRRRFEFMLLDGEAAQAFADRAEVWRLLAEVDVHPVDADVVRAAVYTFRGRWAENWRAGRVLLAGDAAHQMPPLMAQGFNSGMRDVVALAWRLDLVLGNRASADLLDSYTAERLPHVRQIVEQSVNLGRLICVTDPEAQRARNAFLRQLRDNPSEAVLVPPPWRSGPGVFLPSDDHAGYLGVQGRIEIDGRVGLLDDLLGYGRFVRVSRLAEPSSTLSAEAQEIWRRLDGVDLHITDNGPVRDVDGFYGEWLDQLGVEVAVMRPDFQVYGTAHDQAGVEALMRALARQLDLRIPMEEHV